MASSRLDRPGVEARREPAAGGPMEAAAKFCDERGAKFSSPASIGVVATTSRQLPSREVTRALIVQIAGGEQGAKLRSQVTRWHPGATSDQVEDAFQEACARAERSCRGQSEGEVFTWLRTTTHHELGHIRKRAWRRSRQELLVDISAVELQPVAGAARAPEDELIDREDQAEVERVTRAVLERLSERQRAIAALYSHGRRRPEIAEHLGMTPRSVKRALERIMAVGREELVRLAGHGCESGESLVARFAFGLAGPREVRQAQLHLATCPRCGALYERLDVWRAKVAVLLPVPVAEQARPGLIERALHGAAEALSSGKRHGRDGVSAVREHVADGASQLKQHTYARVVDPTPLAGLRPGAAAAAIAGCLAVGGGATYCAQKGVDPIGGLTAVVAPAHHEKRPEPRRKPARAAQVPTDPVVTATVTAPTPTPTPAAPVPTRQAATQPTAQPEPSPVPQEEYEPVNPTGGGTTARQASSTPSKPAPAPAGGPGEFDGP